MELYLHDNTPALPGEKHGSDGPTHMGRVCVDYEYQAEIWVQDIEIDVPSCMMIKVPILNRAWIRNEAGKMEEVPFDSVLNWCKDKL